MDHTRVALKFDISFSSHYILERWYRLRFLRSPSAVPRYSLFGLPGDNTVHLYIISVTWHWPFRGHSDFTPQKHGFSSLTSLLITFLLWDFIMLDMFCVQEKLTFTVFLSKIRWSLFSFEKCWSIKFKNRSGTLVEIFLIKGRLNQTMLRERFRFCFMFFLSV